LIHVGPRMYLWPGWCPPSETGCRCGQSVSKLLHRNRSHIEPRAMKSPTFEFPQPKRLPIAAQGFRDHVLQRAATCLWANFSLIRQFPARSCVPRCQPTGSGPLLRVSPATCTCLPSQQQIRIAKSKREVYNDNPSVCKPPHPSSAGSCDRNQ